MEANARLRSEIDTRLPRGAPVHDVEAWLAAKGMEHSGLIDNAKLAHMGHDPDTYEIRSIIRGTGGIALVHTDTQLTFIFDRAQKLIEYRIASVHTGL